MIMQVEHLTKSFGGRTLFSDACFRLEAHDRLALVGPNGAGKTTMLKVITGHEDADSGNVVFAKGAVVGYLEQTAPFSMRLSPASKKFSRLSSASMSSRQA